MTKEEIAEMLSAAEASESSNYSNVISAAKASVYGKGLSFRMIP